jgi:quinol monooxygenase YgiN
MRAFLSAVALVCLLALPAALAQKGEKGKGEKQKGEKEGLDFAARVKSIKGAFTVIVHFKVKKDEQKKWDTAIRPLIAATLKEEGCLAYDVNRDIEDATRYTIYERWRSSQALEKHLEAEHTKKILALMRKVGEGEPDIILAQRLAPTK